jgi:hypothetical protein
MVLILASWAFESVHGYVRSVADLRRGKLLSWE